MDRNAHCRVEREDRGGVPVLRLIGELNESMELEERISGVSGNRVIVNLKGVTRINSCGVRDWINAIKILAESCEVEFEECSCSVMDQLKMIANFLQSGEIKSFYAPYVCHACNKRHEVLLSIEEHFPDPEAREAHAAPGAQCPDCSGDMEFGDSEDKYFLFIEDL